MLMVRRIFTLVLFIAMIVGAAVTYDMKHKAELAADRNAKLAAEIARDKDSIALLRAEWALLTQPSRLQALVDKYTDHFKLQAFSPAQIHHARRLHRRSRVSPTRSPSARRAIRRSAGHRYRPPRAFSRP